jgi:hypothetical protein
MSGSAVPARPALGIEVGRVALRRPPRDAERRSRAARPAESTPRGDESAMEGCYDSPPPPLNSVAGRLKRLRSASSVAPC